MSQESREKEPVDLFTYFEANKEVILSHEDPEMDEQLKKIIDGEKIKGENEASISYLDREVSIEYIDKNGDVVAVKMNKGYNKIKDYEWLEGKEMLRKLCADMKALGFKPGALEEDAHGTNVRKSETLTRWNAIYNALAGKMKRMGQEG